MKVTLETIPSTAQRYPTAGDWFYDADMLRILVTEQGDKRFTLLLMVHELIESFLCDQAGITAAMVDAFDMEHAKTHLKIDPLSEPGDDPNAPYRHQHFQAETIERMLAIMLGVDWREYCEACYYST